MKKNLYTTQKSADTQVSTSQGLFANKPSRQKIVQQLKKGTLFRFNHKKQPAQTSTPKNSPTDDLKTWIYDIKLGLQNPNHRSSVKAQGADTMNNTKLPMLKKMQSEGKQNKNERRCDRIACFTKKLAKIAAWREENPHNIQRSIEKLEKSLNLDTSSLSQNDFFRVEGSNASQNKSLQMSLNELDKSTILENKSGFNPFSKFPLFSGTVGQSDPLRKKGKQMVVNKQESLQNCYIPEFLMTSIILNSK